MFCPKCGKYYDYAGATCRECEVKERQNNSYQAGGYYNPSYDTYSQGAYYPSEPDYKNRAYGIGKAIL